MIEIGRIDGVDAITGWPAVRLEDGATVAGRPPKIWMVTTSAGGDPAHTHTAEIGVLQVGDTVGVIPIRGRTHTEWVIVAVY